MRCPSSCKRRRTRLGYYHHSPSLKTRKNPTLDGGVGFDCVQCCDCPSNIMFHVGWRFISSLNVLSQEAKAIAINLFHTQITSTGTPVQNLVLCDGDEIWVGCGGAEVIDLDGASPIITFGLVLGHITEYTVASKSIMIVLPRTLEVVNIQKWERNTWTNIHPNLYQGPKEDHTQRVFTNLQISPISGCGKAPLRRNYNPSSMHPQWLLVIHQMGREQPLRLRRIFVYPFPCYDN